MRFDVNGLKIIYALNRFPNKTNSELSKIVGMKPSTFTTIKTKYQKNGWIKLVRIPHPSVIGMKVRGIELGVLKKELSSREALERLRKIGIQIK